MRGVIWEAKLLHEALMNGDVLDSAQPIDELRQKRFEERELNKTADGKRVRGKGKRRPPSKIEYVLPMYEIYDGLVCYTDSDVIQPGFHFR